MENSCVRLLFISSNVAEEEENESGFCNFEYCELRVWFHILTVWNSISENRAVVVPV